MIDNVRVFQGAAASVPTLSGGMLAALAAALAAVAAFVLRRL